MLLAHAATLGLVDVRCADPVGARRRRDQWGGDDLAALSRHDGLLAVRHDGLLAVRRTSLGRDALGLDAASEAPSPSSVSSVPATGGCSPPSPSRPRNGCGRRRR